jgi:hypothetical protein
VGLTDIQLHDASALCTCRYSVAEGENKLYVAFMGTKQRRDLVANANILQEPIWPDPFGSSDEDEFQQSVCHCGLIPQ